MEFATINLCAHKKSFKKSENRPILSNRAIFFSIQIVRYPQIERYRCLSDSFVNTVPNTDRESDERWASYNQFCKATYFRVLPLFPVVFIALESPSFFLSYFLHISLKFNSTVRYKTFFSTK